MKEFKIIEGVHINIGGDEMVVNIAIGGNDCELPKGFTDDDIFFYCANEDCYDKLRRRNNGEDFFITDGMELCFRFRGEVYIKGNTISEIRDKWCSLGLFSAEALEEYYADIVETESIERVDDDSYENVSI